MLTQAVCGIRKWEGCGFCGQVGDSRTRQLARCERDKWRGVGACKHGRCAAEVALYDADAVEGLATDGGRELWNGSFTGLAGKGRSRCSGEDW